MKKIKWHYVLTIDIPGMGAATASQTIDLFPGASREHLYRAVKENMLRTMAAEHELSLDQIPKPLTLFWSAEPDCLDATAPSGDGQEQPRG
ncbi:hypothetical protein ACFYUJ_39155 [Streptomyces sp. NPDC004520]|uniref:hypothetical protein n=1 Tax=Streptomyces sp. NPDC004520 TaxID=3364702 RepID=UPI00367788BF